MKLKEVNANEACVLMNPDDLLIICNALNEVCNGLDVPEFATRMGVEREEALRLLKIANTIYAQLMQHS